MKKPYPFHQSIRLLILTVIPTLLLTAALFIYFFTTILQMIFIGVIILLIIMIGLTIYDINTYINAKQDYQKSQYYMMYKRKFSTVLSSDTLYTHYLITKILLKQYADHAEILNHLTIKQYADIPIDILLLHKKGVFAINTTQPKSQTLFKQSVKALQASIKTTIHPHSIASINELPTLIETINNGPNKYKQSDIHKLYDNTLAFAIETIPPKK